MNIPNRITINQLRDMPPGKIATFSVEEMDLLLEDLNGAKAHLAAIENKLRSGLDLKYGQKSSELRRASGKDTGTVRVAPTDSSALPAYAFTSVRNEARSLWTTTTPICGQLWTTTPPALSAARSRSRVWPGFATLALRMYADTTPSGVLIGTGVLTALTWLLLLISW